MIRISDKIILRNDEVCFKYILASGPGGQNVNKVATAVQLRFDIKNSPSIPDDTRERLIKLAGKRATSKGELIITAKRYRTRERNRRDSIDRLANLIRKASTKPRTRKKTRPSLAEKQKRLEEKHQRARKRQLRQPVGEWQ